MAILGLAGAGLRSWSPAVAACAAGLAVSIVPGWLLGRVIGSGADGDPLTLPATAFALSIALVTVIGLATSALALSVYTVLAGVLATSIVLALLRGREPGGGDSAAMLGRQRGREAADADASLVQRRLCDPDDDGRLAVGQAGAEAVLRSASADRPHPADVPPGSDVSAHRPHSADLPGSGVSAAAGNGWSESSARVLLITVTLVAVWMALGAENIARDRMWYLAYVTRLGSGLPIDWTEPLLGTGHVVARFAYNGWLLALGAWQALSGVRGAFLFETVAPPLLTIVTASAFYTLGRTLFGSSGRAAIATTTTLVVLLATRYPFFSPDRYAFFGRLAEDKSVALLCLMPVALAAAIELLASQRAPAAPVKIGLALVLLLVAVAFSHALVYLLLLATLLAYGLWTLRSGTSTPRNVVATLVLAAVVATGPAAIGFRARSQVAEHEDALQMLDEDPTHPIVRSHLRMDRLVELPAGGPIVDPHLVAEPLLLLALAGLLVALARARTRWGGFLLTSTLPWLAVAFTPYLSPFFGRLVLPWMAYRALWAVPFGLLLGALVVEGPDLLPLPRPARRALAVGLALLVVAMAVPRIPWERLSLRTTMSRAGDETADRLEPDASTLALLDEIAKLPPSAHVAAAAGLAELIPAYAGRSVLAFSDRGTVVFSGSRRRAERRLISNAALIGLYGGSRRLRDRIVGHYDITHTVYEGLPCDRRAALLYRNERFSLCAERAWPGRHARVPLTTAVAGDEAEGRLVAALGGNILCTPSPEVLPLHGVRRWRRAGRWSGRAVATTCSIRFDQPTLVDRLRIVANLPRAREAILYRVEVETDAGTVLKRRGALEFKLDPNGELTLPAHWITALSVRLAPAYLPYLNLKALELRGR